METAWFRGEGGGEWEMSLPLPEHQQQKADRGALTRITGPGGTEWREPAEQPTAATETPSVVMSKPPVNAGKDVWVAWAVHCGADPVAAEAMTKAALVDAYTPKDDQPPATPPAVTPEGGDQ